MDRKTLKFFRLLIPGLTLIFVFLPIFEESGIEYKIGEGWFVYSFLVIPAIVLGSIYNMLDIRFFITEYSHRKIDLNITSSLLKLYNKELTQEQYNFLKNKRLKHIFYKIVDNDASLTAKSQLVYSNGIFWTSTADVFLISIFAAIIYIAVGVPIGNAYLWTWGIIIGGVGLVSFLLHLLTVFRHINLSNDQLEYIETHYVKQLKEKIDEVLQ